MKTGFLKLLIAAMLSTVSLMASAQTKSVAATFDSGETEPAGVGTQLQTSNMLKDDVAIPGSARSSASTTDSAAPETPQAPVNSAPPAGLPAPATVSTTPPSESRVAEAARPTFDSRAQWHIQNGERISDVFVRWARVVGWQLTWEPSDLVALADLELDDTFSGAITKVIDAVNRGGADIQAKFYVSNHMLRIMARK